MAMPRPEVKYEDTWICKIYKEYPDSIIIDKSRRASTTFRLVQEGGGGKDGNKGSDLLEFYRPDIVIMQLGITDCAPRYVNHRSYFIKIINYLPKFIKNAYYKHIRKTRVRNPDYATVSLEEFKFNLLNYFNRANEINSHVIAIKIAPVTKQFVKKSPYINDNIKKYNIIYEEVSSENNNSSLIEPFDIENVEKYAIDEFHVNKAGHQIIFNKIKKVLDKRLCLK